MSRVVESSPVFARVLREVRFKGRCRIVGAMRRGPWPSGVRTACDGLHYDLDMSDDIQRAIYFGCYEPNEIELVMPRVDPGGTCVDVGANIGFYTLHFARRVGREGNVYAFEPDPRNAAKLRRNISLNGFDPWVRVNETALSDHEGTAVLHRSDDAHSGWGSLAPHANETGAIEVPVTTLDAFLERERIERVDLLKADVEGSEVELLRGAERSLRRRAIRYLYIEFNGVRLKEQGLGLPDFLAPLESAGYRPAPVHADLVARMKRGSIRAHTVWPNLLFEAP